MRARFGSPARLLAWHLTSGRASFGGLKAIDYDKVGGGRDVFARDVGNAVFALTTLCLAAVESPARQEILRLRYAEGLSDLRIAERQHTSETTVRRERSRGLRAIEEKARALAREAIRLTGETLLEEG